MVTEEKIGPRIRQLRIERDMTQELLAHLAGLTTGYICRIENSPSSPPVSTLIKISEALGVGVDAVFSEEGTSIDYTLVRRSERKPFSWRGNSIEFLAPRFPNRHMEPFVFSVPAGAGKTKEESKPGDEMVFDLEGRCILHIGEKTVELDEGDCTYYNRSIPHCGEGVDGGKILALIVRWAPDKPQKNADEG